jgi:hypothetical protein
MKPIPAPDTNLTLTHPDGGGDLPACQCIFTGEDGDNYQHGYETTWQPSLGETRALANGAPVVLQVWGQAHPPVNVTVGEPADDAVALIPVPIVDDAIRNLRADLDLDDITDLWTRALDKAKNDAA